MMDLLYLAAAGAFFVATWYLLRMCGTLLDRNPEDKS